MKFAVLVSGSGTNLQALLDREAAGELAPAHIALVLSNRPGVRALDRAEAAGKTAVAVDHKQFASREAHEEAVLEALRSHDIEAIALAGYMRILTAGFVDQWQDRILNTHPSLLPSFPGIDGARQAVNYGVKLAGCTVHLVDSTLDGGPIVLQAAVEVREDDDENSLQRRIQEREYQLLPQAVQLMAARRLHRDGRRVRIADGT